MVLQIYINFQQYSFLKHRLILQTAINLVTIIKLNNLKQIDTSQHTQYINQKPSNIYFILYIQLAIFQNFNIGIV